MRPGFLHNAGHRNFPALPGFYERGHVLAAPLAAVVEPFVNQPLGEPCEPAVAFRVADDAIVVPHAAQLVLERGDDFGHRKAPRFPEPAFVGFEAVAEFLGDGHAPRSPVVRIVRAFPPEEVEAEEGELPAAFAFASVEFDQRALLRGEF
jgi:hypothetical protein